MDLVEPVIDGKVTDYYEWRSAGHADLSAQGAMYQQATRNLLHLYYGFDLSNFYLRLDPSPQAEPADQWEIVLYVHAPKEMVVSFPWHSPTEARLIEGQDHRAEAREKIAGVAKDRIFEIKVPFAALGMCEGEEARFSVSLVNGDEEVEHHPRDGFISFAVPDDCWEASYWSV